MEAVISLGTVANEAWDFWKATPAGKASTVVHAAVTHPTQPESSSGGDKAKLATATTKLLQNWNAGLQLLSPAIAHPDDGRPLVLFGSSWGPATGYRCRRSTTPRAFRRGCASRTAGRSGSARHAFQASEHHAHDSERGRFMKPTRAPGTR